MKTGTKILAAMMCSALFVFNIAKSNHFISETDVALEDIMKIPYANAETTKCINSSAAYCKNMPSKNSGYCVSYPSKICCEATTDTNKDCYDIGY